MTKAQAIEDIVFWYDNQCKTEIPYAAISHAYMNLILSQPDLETGLVPCGMGHKATRMFDTAYDVWETGCPVCKVFTQGETKEEANKNWNNVMGYKEAANAAN